MESGAREHLNVQAERAILAGLLLPGDQLDPHDPLGELRALADTAGAVVIDEVLQKRMKPTATTFMGKGKINELAEIVKARKIDCVIFENDLSPSQIKNIEEIIETKVLDRSELILDIFAARARTTEARIQVELAQLQYTYPRLRAMWSHLERIVGGAPAGIGTRGPGEQQLEIDRRIVQRKKAQLRREIAEIQARKSREVEARNTDFYTVGLVGYTNAGKSTLFNKLTTTPDGSGGGAYADDKLFATLSTRTRKWSLGEGDSVMLSDTVGFVRNLPHHLVASFKATLEEAIHSDLLLLVVDVADPHAQANLATVRRVLDEIGAIEPERLVVLNKVDKMRHNAELLLLEQEEPDALPISAVTGLGLDALVERVGVIASGGSRHVTLTLPITAGRSISMLERQCKVADRTYRGKMVDLEVTIGNRQLDKVRALGELHAIDGELISEQVTAAGWGQ